MNSADVLSLGRQALELTALLSAPVLLSALVVGLLIGILQAATQINEMTLAFVPKLIVTVVALLIAGPWMLELLIGFTERLLEGIPEMIG